MGLECVSISGLLSYMKDNVYFISLGCDKNLVDSEEMIGQLRSKGFHITDDIEEAGAVVINTCCFIGDAKEESINTILEIADRKNTGSDIAIIVTGCLSERYRDEILKEIPEVDAILGTASTGDIVQAVESALSGEKPRLFAPKDGPVKLSGLRDNTSGLNYAYLKIAEGCDKRCTYCIIPSLRGGYRSVDMESLTEEAGRLASQGVEELILVAQETTLYGVDLYGKKSLHLLLRRLSEIDGIRWIRILYCYPEEVYDDLIEEIADNNKVCHYLDMPIQHASDDILKRMGRRTTRKDLTDIINGLRERIPDIALRTTLISGFPGETQEDFEELYRFVNEMEFDRLGVFRYSREEDTPAYSFPDQIPEEIAAARCDELMELQQEICFEKASDKVGQVFDVVIDGVLAEDNVYIGRTYMDAPDVDGYVFMPVDRERMSGDFVRVRITDARDYDLTGEIL